ncbi:PilZ domain-containing protein [Gilvimarinus chinensis]|uniref:PilZ domain-containing protein n=1 Tax=Gilvimarinus chinensis TaxID=396005 RepID=UPI00037F1862|nr:PilZ domain-containing protein [Gilvimarinus chinensis]
MSNTDRRRFSRIPFDLNAELSQASLVWQAKLRDISLNGALISGPKPPQLDTQVPIQLNVELSDQVSMSMLTRLAHYTDQELGLECQSIDLDSVQHLRRLIELNLGDPAAAERELHELLEPK